MNNNTSSIVSKVWSFCNPLRDVGVGYGDYLEQLTYLLFLKIADDIEQLGIFYHKIVFKEKTLRQQQTSKLLTLFGYPRLNQ
jgi:type I restriction-modification system DNA methylase subunit